MRWPPRWLALGVQLRAGREAQGRSQAWVAVRVGVTPTSVGRHERGHHRPSREHLARYATVLRIDREELLVLAAYVLPRLSAVD